MSALVVRVVLDGGGEEGIDEGCLPQTRFTSNLRLVSHGPQHADHLEYSYHYREGCSSFCDDLVSLVWEIGDPNR
jgi:hypothetical protein